jgi:sec-independent protein translocase protein TatB
MLSIPHLIVIFVIALVIFGPEKLPELARNMGKLMAEFRRATTDIRGTFETHLRELEREADTRRIDSVRPNTPTSAPPEMGAPANTPEITPVEGTVPESAPHEAAVAAANPAQEGQPLGTPSSGTDQHTTFGGENDMLAGPTYPEDPEELIRQAEAQIARERAGEFEDPERVSDGAIGKP